MSERGQSQKKEREERERESRLRENGAPLDAVTCIMFMLT